MICVYDDAINISGLLSKAPRYELKGKRYFSGVYKETKKNYELWKEVSDYIEATYDTEYLEQIYILGDGANWIKAGCEYIADSQFVLSTHPYRIYKIAHGMSKMRYGKQKKMIARYRKFIRNIV